MIVGVGVDLLHLPRLAKLAQRQASGISRLAQRILSREERLEFGRLCSDGEDARLKYLAVRWTAKEAAYKALYPRIRASWKDVSVRKHGNKPSLELSSEGLAKLEVEKVKLHLSISHDGEYVTAFVIAEQL